MFKVSGKSDPKSIAGALAKEIVERNAACIDIYVIGAGALNQAVKAIAIARGFAAPHGVDLICIPSFATVEDVTALRLSVMPR